MARHAPWFRSIGPFLSRIDKKFQSRSTVAQGHIVNKCRKVTLDAIYGDKVAKQKRVLADHKRFGSKFLPPIHKIGGLGEVSYVNQLLPEVLWMGLLNRTYGYKEGVALASELASQALEHHSTDRYQNFAMTSSYLHLTDTEKSEVVESVTGRGRLERYQSALAPLLVLYRSFPLGFIGSPTKETSAADLLNELKATVSGLMNKFDTPALIAQANLTHIRGATGGLHMAPHIEIPDLDSLITKPDSEAARRAGGFVRSSALMELGHGGEKDTDWWAREFWNTSYRIDNCSFSWESDVEN